MKRADRLALAKAFVDLYTLDELKTKLREAAEMGAAGRAASWADIGLSASYDVSGAFSVTGYMDALRLAIAIAEGRAPKIYDRTIRLIHI